MHEPQCETGRCICDEPDWDEDFDQEDELICLLSEEQAENANLRAQLSCAQGRLAAAEALADWVETRIAEEDHPAACAGRHCICRALAAYREVRDDG